MLYFGIYSYGSQLLDKSAFTGGAYVPISMPLYTSYSNGNLVFKLGCGFTAIEDLDFSVDDLALVVDDASTVGTSC